jgi:hypothetical protein
LNIFKQFVKSIEIPRRTEKQLVKLYTLGLISYNAIDSIADAESDPKDLNLFLSMFIEYKIIFDKLSKETEYVELLEKINNSVNRQYLQCANEPSSVKFKKIQGIRSIPYVMLFVLALFLSPNVKYHKSYKDIIKCCFCFCAIRQTSDDLKDLEDDIKNDRATLPSLLFNWQKGVSNSSGGEIVFDLTDSVKYCIAENSLAYCKERLQEIEIILNDNKPDEDPAKNPSLLIINYWHDISSKIILSIEKYCEILAS